MTAEAPQVEDDPEVANMVAALRQVEQDVRAGRVLALAIAGAEVNGLPYVIATAGLAGQHTPLRNMAACYMLRMLCPGAMR